MLNPDWQVFSLDNLDEALAMKFCLYALHHKKHKERPYYIGKAKYFGTKQQGGYKASARYNSGYVHLLAGMLSSGYKLYIAHIGESRYLDAEKYEQELIHEWTPVRDQRKKPKIRKKICLEKPWITTYT